MRRGFWLKQFWPRDSHYDLPKRSWFFITLMLSFSLCCSLEAQDFLKNLITNSPGTLTKHHQEWDKVSGCIECHNNRLGGEVVHPKCMSCHPDIKARVDAGRGFHKDKKDCALCHNEHQGKNHSLFPKNWVQGYEYGLMKKPKQKMKAFDHDEDTGWELRGAHAEVECLDCHTEKRKHYKTGASSTTTSYLFETPPNCYSCHSNVYEHESKESKWTQCTDCHSSGIESWKALTKRMPFNHNKQTDYRLEGRHEKVACAECHQPDEKMKRVTTFAPLDFKQCTDCHYDIHEGKYGTECQTCHSVYRDWSDLQLTKSQTKDSKSGKKASINFDHGKTKFPLKGYHEAVTCESCHYNVDGTFTFKEGSSAFDECSDCHGKAHGDQFKDQKCTDCHSENLRFTNSTYNLAQHNQTKFPLDGKHQVIDCQKCHFSGQYEQLPSAECSDCHRNVHPERQIDKSCSFCHVTTDFSWIQFDHNKNTNFNLTGEHREVACLSCHVDQVFKNMPASNEKPNCQMCHADPHGDSMPNECQNCHVTESFNLVKGFKHQEYGGFVLDGRHAELSCQKCHAQHLEGVYKVKVLPGADRANSCNNCHSDIHKGKFGTSCATCHNTSSFEVEYGEQVHDLGYFKLSGTHDLLNCTDCHATDTQLQGSGIVCAGCHEKNDIHLGQMGLECVDCHNQTAWSPVNFKHNTTGFRLTGAHRYVACESCHKNQVYQGLPNDCYFCHSDSFVPYIAAHTGGVSDCESCHTTIDWRIRRGSGIGATK